jgi:hypothetical protein
VSKHRPTEKQRDERVKVDLTPEELIEGVLAAGPHADEDDERSE